MKLCRRAIHHASLEHGKGGREIPRDRQPGALRSFHHAETPRHRHIRDSPPIGGFILSGNLSASRKCIDPDEDRVDSITRVHSLRLIYRRRLSGFRLVLILPMANVCGDCERASDIRDPYRTESKVFGASKHRCSANYNCGSAGLNICCDELWHATEFVHHLVKRFKH